MKKTILLAFLAVAALPAMAGKYTKYVDPIIGTGALDNSLSGNCYPGPTMPFGMVQLSPDTQDELPWNYGPGYQYKDKEIWGFTHTHLSGTGCQEFFDVLLLPTSDLTTDQPHPAYSHDQEEARVGYYKVTLGGVKAELSATTRVGIHRYTYAQGQPQRVFLDIFHSATKTGDYWERPIINSQIRIISPTVVEGYRVMPGWAPLRKVYYHMEFSRPIADYTFITPQGKYHTGKVVNGSGLKALLDFDPKGGQELKVKVAISPVSIENARQNMQAEATSWDFQSYVDACDQAWDKLLSRVDVEGSEEDKTMFYTGLYHGMIQPNILNDVNGQYMANDYTTRTLPKGKGFYSTFSLWDTYRALHPLYNILVPEMSQAFVESMMDHYDTYGYLPMWQLWGQENYCMIGNHALPVLVDAVFSGTAGLDAERIYEACKTSATTPHLNSPFELWDKYGYMPDGLQAQSVSITLEQAYDDWCVARLAKRLGKQADYEHFMKRSQFYRNLFNPKSGFFEPKKADGSWADTNFDPLVYGANGDRPYTEGNAWQWNWYVPQDIEGLITLLGGKKAFGQRLDQFFTITDQSGEKNINASGFVGQYIHGNETDQHVPYLYNYVGQPRKTQEMVHRIIREFYDTRSTGYAGNDDCGEMSAWYIFSAMGFYPVNPCSGVYSIGSPVLDKATIHLQNGRDFTVKVNRKRPTDIYVHAVKLNGKSLKDLTLTFDDIQKGGELVFTMGK